MCVVALALNAHPHWRIVLAANRDEFHARPSTPLARWDGDESHIIAGRDLQSGGAWLGVSEQGRLAVVTNIRTGRLPDPDKLSRGALISNFLRGDSDFADLDAYNPFSLFAVDRQQGWFAANRPQPEVTTLPAGIHSLSNGLPADPWPRRELLHRSLASWLAADRPDPLALFNLLADETPLCPENSQAPIFIRDEQYGTRCSTVVAIGKRGKGIIVERRFAPDSVNEGTTTISFDYA